MLPIDLTRLNKPAPPSPFVAWVAACVIGWCLITYRVAAGGREEGEE